MDSRYRATRHQRTASVLTDAGVDLLQKSRVLVVGCGGLGSPVLTYLASGAVGTLGFADDDLVEPTNLNRQVIHTPSDIGRHKVDSAIDYLTRLASEVKLEPYHRRLAVDERDDALLASYDLVLDCTDSFSSKYALADAAARAGVPLIWGTVVAQVFQVAGFWSRPTRAGYAPSQLRDLYPAPPQAGLVDPADVSGVLGAVVGQCGSVMANEAIKFLTHTGTGLFGRLLIADAAAARWDTIGWQPLP